VQVRIKRDSNHPRNGENSNSSIEKLAERKRGETRGAATGAITKVKEGSGRKGESLVDHETKTVSRLRSENSMEGE